MDEFQDTDAIQTELLFHLTSEEKDFAWGDWQKCTPRPGSLFPVGDPKQAIYRFRGADIDTYSRVRDRFTGGIGEFKQLAFNFRSTKEICDLTRNTFRPLLADPGNRKPDDRYQADYADMRAVHTVRDNRDGASLQERANDPDSILLAYSADQKGDAPNRIPDDYMTVAALVRRLCDSGAAVPGDFLILTDRKRSASRYAQTLLEAGLPVNISGEETFSETSAIAAAAQYLDYLLERDDPIRLQCLLERRYGVRPETVLRLNQRGGLGCITDAFRRAEDGGSGWDRLDALTAALCAEPQQDTELLALCAALDEIRRFRRLRASAPALSTLERMFSDLACLWPKQETRLQRRRGYARVRQFIARLRAETAGDFPSLRSVARRTTRTRFAALRVRRPSRRFPARP